MCFEVLRFQSYSLRIAGFGLIFLALRACYPSCCGLRHSRASALPFLNLLQLRLACLALGACYLSCSGLLQGRASELSLVYSLLQLRLAAEVFERDTQVAVGFCKVRLQSYRLLIACFGSSSLPSSWSMLPKLLWASA